MVNFFEKIVNENLMLMEGAETRNMKLAKHYLYDNCGYDESHAMQIIGSIKTDIPNVRLGKCKFILGITRMFVQGELSDGGKVLGINKSLKYIASDAHINEYDNDLNGMHCDEIIARFSSVAKSDMENEKEELSQMEYTNNNSYTIIRISDFDTASQYSDYVSWCVTYDSEMYDAYTHGGMGLFYFCLKDGFETVLEEKGEGCPLDKYGLSMIAVSVNDDGSCNTITCRWNHDNNGNDNIMSPKELSLVIGRNFYEAFPPRSPEEIAKKKRAIFVDFLRYAEEAWDDFSTNGFDVYKCCNETSIEICYDDDYEEGYDGDFYDVNGELCNAYEDESYYKRNHAKYAIIGGSIRNGEVDEPNYNDDTYYIIADVSTGDLRPLVGDYFLNITEVKGREYFIVKDINSNENILFTNGSYGFNEKINHITYLSTNPRFGTIRKGNQVYVFDFDTMKIWDKENVFEYKERTNDVYTIGNSRIYIQLHKDSKDVIYSLNDKKILVSGEFKIFGNNSSILIAVCDKDIDYRNYSLYTINNEGYLEQLTDNHVRSLMGYYNSDYYGFWYGTSQKQDKYVFSFSKKKIYHAEGAYYNPVGEPVKLINNAITIESIEKEFKALYEQINKNYNADKIKD